MRLFSLIGKELSHHTAGLQQWWRTTFVAREDGSQISKVRLALLMAGGFMLLGIASMVIFVLCVRFGVFGSIPSESDLLNINNFNASEIYATEGEMIGKYFIENRSDAHIEEVSPFVSQALIATEDARFMDHRGVDMRAAARVIWKSIILGQEESGGGSTLSQQLAKNLYPRQQHGFLSMPVNKLREMMIARRLEKVYSKQGLLNLYLNTVPFSRNIYGIKIASDQFFSTTPAELKVEEAAVLIGMLKGTSIYDPKRNPEKSQERRNVVLRQMQQSNFLTQAETDSLIQLPLTLKFNRQHKESRAPYFQEHLKGALTEILADIRKPNGDPYGLFTDGLKIYTTLDATMQRYAEEAVAEQMKKLQTTFDKHWKGRAAWRSERVLEKAIRQSKRYQTYQSAGHSEEIIDSLFALPVEMTIFDWEKGEAVKQMSPLDSVKFYLSLLHAGFLAAEPQTGQIKAWVGGIDYAYFQYDHVKSRRQVGSTFKPIVYAEAIEQGVDPCNYYHNDLVTYPKWDNWQPRNSDGQYGGFYSMAGGLSKSVNTITVEVLFQTGIEPVRELAQEMGISSSIPKGPAIALGAMEGSLYDMVQVYCTLANRGKKMPLHYIQRIENAYGEVLYEYEMEKPRQVLREENADLVNEMLQMVVDSGTARRVRYHYGLGGEIAGKTGTTQNQSDGWFMGYKSNLVAGAWVGAELPIVRFRSLSLGQGASTALPIWGQFMRKVYKDKSYKSVRYAKFAALSEDAQYKLECDPYLSDEMLDFDLLEEEAERNNWLRNLFGDRAQAFNPEDYQDGVSPEELEALEERMEKAQRKQDRREKLKNLWGKKLFGKDDDGG